jgi:hypothetical protein
MGTAPGIQVATDAALRIAGAQNAQLGKRELLERFAKHIKQATETISPELLPQAAQFGKEGLVTRYAAGMKEAANKVRLDVLVLGLG